MEAAIDSDPGRRSPSIIIENGIGKCRLTALPNATTAATAAAAAAAISAAISTAKPEALRAFLPGRSRRDAFKVAAAAKLAPPPPAQGRHDGPVIFKATGRLEPIYYDVEAGQ